MSFSIVLTRKPRLHTPLTTEALPAGSNVVTAIQGTRLCATVNTRCNSITWVSEVLRRTAVVDGRFQKPSGSGLWSRNIFNCTLLAGGPMFCPTADSTVWSISRKKETGCAATDR